MVAPVQIAHTHVHSLRIRSGAEALVARVLTPESVAGYGFTLSLNAAAARDMAAWDALARSRNVPLFALFGRKQRDHVAVVCVAQPEHSQVDPFALGSVEAALTLSRATPDASLALVAPNTHAWELSYCAALAAALTCRDACIIVRVEARISAIAVPEDAGIGVDWSLEPEFGAIRW